MSAASPADNVESNAPLRLVDLLDVLGYRDDEFASVCHQAPGGQFRGSVMPAEIAPRYVEPLRDDVNVWHSVNPTSGPARADGGRGTEAQTTRLSALYADLDLKPGACRDLDHAAEIVDELSNLLGQRPTLVVFSGHGIQPYWPIDDGDIGEAFTVDDARSLLRRFGRLVDVVADTRGASVDNVFDLARILRTPGTFNHKGAPVAVTARRDVGGPLSVTEVDERLTEVGIDRQPDDASSSEPLSDPVGWAFAPRTCAYVATVIAGLSTDGPRLGGGRNPWACNQAVRLDCAWRLGCITEADYRGARAQIETRLDTLLSSTERRRSLRRYEMRDVFALGRRRASCKTDDGARAELRNHGHGFDDWGGTPAPVLAPVVVDDSPPTSTSWEPFDLGPYLRGEVELATPSRGIARNDGLRLLYPGREHAAIGETESGKSWFALQCVATELLAGNGAVYIHYEESDPSSTIERLLLLGVPPAVMTALLRFVAPAQRLGTPDWMDALLRNPAPTLVVHDGVNEAMALHGLEIAGSAGAEGWSTFRRHLVSPAIRAGASVLSCDHVAKNRDGQGRDAYGSVHKGNALDGARFVLENVEPFGRGMRGASHVYVTKDRPGHLRAHGRPDRLTGKTYLGTLVADASNPFEPFSLVLYAPKDGAEPTAVGDGDADLADAVFDVIAARPGRTVETSRELFRAMRAAGHTARDEAYRNAVADLVIAGRVAKVSKGQAAGYRVVESASGDKAS